MIAKIVSGGQTGADRAALDFAIRHGTAHGGWCPKGRLAEDGAIPGRYCLRETSTAIYAERTERNVRDSDGTVILTIGWELAGGSRKTEQYARIHDKPCLHLSRDRDCDPGGTLRVFCEENRISILNVAGSRASEEPEVYDFTLRTLGESISET